MDRLLQAPFNDAVTPDETLRFVCTVFSGHFPGQSTEFIAAVFHHARSAYEGAYPGYQRCDTPFHDFAHISRATIATVRILDGQLKRGCPPALAPRSFELGVAGIVLHDIGLLKEAGDTAGTGAKHMMVHVDRSAMFAERLLPRLGVAPDEVRLVQLAIQSTALNAAMSRLPFRDEQERLIGCAVGSGDILGTMAAPDYPERLPGLYQELAEAAAHAGPRAREVTRYRSVEDLLYKTRDFYRNYVQRMLEEQWGGIYKTLEFHFADGRNHYQQAIEANLERIDHIPAATKEKKE